MYKAKWSGKVYHVLALDSGGRFWTYLTYRETRDEVECFIGYLDHTFRRSPSTIQWEG